MTKFRLGEDKSLRVEMQWIDGHAYRIIRHVKESSGLRATIIEFPDANFIRVLQEGRWVELRMPLNWSFA